MRLLICGGRTFYNMATLESVMETFSRPDIIIHGAATGADSLANQYAQARVIPVLRFPANWNLYGNRAGIVRNNQMLREGKPTHVLALPGGDGTAHMVKIARQAGIPTTVVDKAYV